MTFGTVASFVSIAAGANSLLGNPLGGGNKGGGGGSSQADPYGKYRGQAATDLNALMKNPATAMSSPGYQQQLQAGTQAQERTAAAGGRLESGAEQTALGQVGQNTFSSYYNSMLANLMQLSGASQQPAAAGLQQQQTAALGQQMQLGNIKTITQSIGGLYNAANPTPATTPYVNTYGASSGYAPTDSSFSYDPSAGQI